MNDRDVAALDAAVAAGLARTTTGELVGELTPERAVLRVVAYHLGRCRARLEDASGGGRHEELAFAKTFDRWQEAWRVPAYPMAIVEGASRRDAGGMTRSPEPDPQDPTVDWLSPDGRFAIWSRGEEEGEGRVLLYASYEPHAQALAAAVEAALQGGPEASGATYLPLPEAFLPTPFQGALPPALYPKARVATLLPSSATENEIEEGAAEGAWRADVRFSWRAPKLVAWPRLPDYDPRFSVDLTRP